MTGKFHSDIKIKKRKTKFFKKLGLFLIFSVSLIFVIFLADVFSTALTAGSFSFVLNKQNFVSIKEKNLYAITMGESTDKFQAFNIGGGVSVLGAGGFVWEENGKYYVVANIYENSSEANKILNGLNESNYEVDVMEIKIPRVKLSFENLNGEYVKDIQNALNRLYGLYEDLYNLAINIDTKNITFIQGGSLVNGYKSECKIIYNKLLLINSGYDNSKIKQISDTYVYVIEMLDTLVYKLLKDGQLNYIVKNAEIELVYKLYGLIKTL